MLICFFEDDICTRFHPLTLTRPTDDLRIGILTIAEKWINTLNNPNWTRCIRSALKNVFPPREFDNEEEYLWINSRYLPTAPLLNQIQKLAPGSLIQSNGAVVAAKINEATHVNWQSADQPDLSSLKTISMDELRCINHLWDFFKLNGSEIAADIERLENPQPEQYTLSTSAILEHEENIYIEEGAEIGPGVILNAAKGPVYIGKEATIASGAIIIGPAAICEKAGISLGAKIRGNTTVGPHCSAGGEISASIIHSYSNKAHDGYLGNSLIGQWCNFGAGTDTSNLKNNYSSVRLADWKTGTPIDTGQQKLGTVMGDHSKTAIGTRLNTGTVCGVNCNIFSTSFPPKHIPSFSWVSSDHIQTYRFDKALETMKTMMAKRGIELTEDYRKMVHSIFETKTRNQ